MLSVKLLFWSALSHPSYWLYRHGLPSAYGAISENQARSAMRLALLSRGRGTLVMKEIIEALEIADGPDRSIDGMIAHAVNLHMPDDPDGWPLRYTESIDAAMTLAVDGWILESMSDEATGRVCELVITGCAVEVTNGQFMAPCTAATRPLALAGAWLKARSLPAI